MSTYQALSEVIKISEIVENCEQDSEAKKLFNFMKSKIESQHAITLNCDNKKLSKQFIQTSFGFLLSEFKRNEITQYIYLDNIDINSIKEIKLILNKTEIHYKKKNKAEKRLKNIIESKKPDYTKQINKHKAKEKLKNK